MPVEVDEGLGLLEVDLEPVTDGVCGVVGSASPQHPFDQLVLLYDEQHYPTQPPLTEGLVERLHLRKSAGKAIENEAGLCIGLSQPIPQHGDSDLVGYVAARFHDLFHLTAELGSLRHVPPKHVPGRDMRNAEPGGHPAGLGAFASTGRAEEKKPQVRKPS